jgi:hypothetical protein
VLVNLAEAAFCGRAVAGGKPTAHGDLLTAGFAVPAGVVVPASSRSDPGLAKQPMAAVARDA